MRQAIPQTRLAQRFATPECHLNKHLSDSDALLVALTIEGDPQAFGELVRRHIRSAYAIALASLANPADAEDVCQDSFIVALQRLEECRDRARFAAWLFLIVRNRAQHYRRYRNMSDTSS